MDNQPLVSPRTALMKNFSALLAFSCLTVPSATAAAQVASPAANTVANVAAFVPPAPPRTAVPAGRLDEFRAYCLTGDGAAPFAKIKAGFDKTYLNLAFPAEPVTYGDPEPKKRTSDRADLWRAAQDTCGLVAGVAEAATLIWLVTGEDRYFEKAKSFLLGACAWHFSPDWKRGPVVGATDIYYNDEAHFRLWRKLPLVYDQLRSRLTAEEKKTVLDHFRERGERSARWIKKSGVEEIRRNSIKADPNSHPVRFMAMTGLSGLALWDDLPEAREWWRFAYVFYRDQFSPWGGNDGGWAEGSAYWRGTLEHAVFQDTLLAIGDPLAYASPFWKNSPYFAVYNVQPYRHTIFGDASNAGHFNLEPASADYLEHLARVQHDGALLTYSTLCTDRRPRPLEKGLGTLDRTYPIATELLVRNFAAAAKPKPAPTPLSTLPPQRHFSDVGWVSLHSALGQPQDDIHITFVSSPYGSFSHSQAHQNAFILNAYGESLAINSAYREFHRSPHHKEWTWQTKSKNALLIDGLGQRPQDKSATGRITRFENTPRTVWTTGDATVAYQTMQSEKNRVRRVTRDLVFVDRRYLVIRDRVELTTPGKLSWLLHAEKSLSWDNATHTAFIKQGDASLTTRLVAPDVRWLADITDKFPVSVDSKYAAGMGSYVTGGWDDQVHFTATSEAAAKSFTVFAVLWPERSNAAAVALDTTLSASGELTIRRPDGRTDTLQLTDDALTLR
jgi:hypothetical protein